MVLRAGLFVLFLRGLRRYKGELRVIKGEILVNRKASAAVRTHRLAHEPCYPPYYDIMIRQLDRVGVVTPWGDWSTRSTFQRTSHLTC